MDMTEGILTEKCGTKELLPSQYKRYREVQIPDGQCHMLLCTLVFLPTSLSFSLKFSHWAKYNRVKQNTIGSNKIKQGQTKYNRGKQNTIGANYSLYTACLINKGKLQIVWISNGGSFISTCIVNILFKVTIFTCIHLSLITQAHPPIFIDHSLGLS